MSFIEIEDVTKTYHCGKHVVRALNGVCLRISHGEFAAVCGPSGSGKSTLMNIMGCIDCPDRGRVAFDGKSIDYSRLSRLDKFRLNTIGFIFQSFNLLPVLTAFENVEYPLLLTNITNKARKARVESMLDRVGLQEHAHHKPNELSGGQQQRVAIARALINQPQVVLADEPTANLDTSTSERILKLMRSFNESDGTTFVIATHDPLVLDYATREIALKDGAVSEWQLTPSKARRTDRLVRT